MQSTAQIPGSPLLYQPALQNKVSLYTESEEIRNAHYITWKHVISALHTLQNPYAQATVISELLNTIVEEEICWQKCWSLTMGLA